jgi:hypothetical protein
MSAELSDRSHASAWVLSSVAIPVLYLLSVPPLDVHARRGDIDLPLPPWFENYSMFYSWCYRNTPLKKPLHPYASWCWDHMPSLY